MGDGGNVSLARAPSFCRVITERHLISKSRVWLGVPINYLQANQPMINRRVILENSAGETWEVILEVTGNGYGGLRTGLEDFACDNSLSVGDVVVFKLVKHSHFHVVIFSKSGEAKEPGFNHKAVKTKTSSAEGQATPRKRRKSNSEFQSVDTHAKADSKDGRGFGCPIVIADDDEQQSHSKDLKDEAMGLEVEISVDNDSAPNPTSKDGLPSDKLASKDEAEGAAPESSNKDDLTSDKMTNEELLNGDSMFSELRQRNLNLTPGTKRAVSAAYMFKKHLKNPSQIIVMTTSTINGSVVFFRQEFGRGLPEGISTIHLTTNKGSRTWPVRWFEEPLLKRPKICGGWRAFTRDNLLKRGDVCVFEALETKVVKVHIFKQQEYPTVHNKSPRRQTRSIMQALQQNNCSKAATSIMQALQKNNSSKAATMTEETVNNNVVFEILMTSPQGKEEANRILASKENLEKANLKICFLKDETGELKAELKARMPLEQSETDVLVASTFPSARALLEHLVKEVST